MFKRVLCTICLIVVFLTTMPVRIAAQTQESGTLIVIVTDAASGKPIDSAQVFLLGADQPQSSLTNAKGLLIFENLQPALYRIAVEADGYKRTELANVEVDEGRQVDVAVRMAPALKTIASVVAHSSVQVHDEGIGAESAQRKVSASLSDALNKLAGVSVDEQLYGADSAFNVSLHNMDPSETASLIDGIHVAGPAAQLVGAAQDLFSGASIDFSPSASGLAGSINYNTIQPTKIWNYRFTGQVGNYANTLGTWAVTGGAGKVALAMEHAASGYDYPLNGLYYADQTGSAYEHEGGRADNANVIKANITISPASNMKLSSMFGNGRTTNVCSNFTTILPCSDGPENLVRNRFDWNGFGFESLAGHLQYTLFANAGSWNNSVSQPDRAVNGIVIPYSASSSYPWFSYGTYTSLTKRRHTFRGGYYGEIQSGSVTTTYNGAALPAANRSSRDSGIWVADKVKANDKLAITHSLSQSSATGAGSTLEFGEELVWQPAKSDTFDLTVGLGSAEPSPNDVSPVGDALSADYDCYNGSVYVDGPADQGVRQASQSYDFGWRHTLKGGFLNVDVHRNNMFGQNMRAAVPIAGEPPSLFPGGSPAAYLQQIQNVWSQSPICGSMPFNPQRVYISQIVSGVPQVNQGVTFSGQIPVGKHIMLFPTYASASAYLTALDPRLLGPGSYYAVGRQLPHRPLHSAGLIFDDAVPRSRLEWLVDAQFTSANNPYDLPAYTTFGAGIVFKGTLGNITVYEKNIFGTRTGLFTTYQGVNPMPLQGGGTFAFSSTPLPPRSFIVRYDINWRQHVNATPAAKPTPKSPA